MLHQEDGARFPAMATHGEGESDPVGDRMMEERKKESRYPGYEARAFPYLFWGLFVQVH
jgi:hypothetical protein